MKKAKLNCLLKGIICNPNLTKTVCLPPNFQSRDYNSASLKFAQFDCKLCHDISRTQIYLHPEQNRNNEHQNLGIHLYSPLRINLLPMSFCSVAMNNDHSWQAFGQVWPRVSRVQAPPLHQWGHGDGQRLLQQLGCGPQPAQWHFKAEGYRGLRGSHTWRCRL